ncbi:(2Fe-2S)-binding protein [Siminovitchia sp. FSL H7-0308]|uniref:Bacterioferritin-associated ferredoxin n=1 Tax=Siminovitchia thermophila TaxID=1245522 RepID=A0ABS2R6V2_9BACI|nr:(2Fe-2S)-binding protein [Siminovitchia thermophila]MBM7714874.1 bacterioferritin-associated ferredoxin [Siminovitchia thermophila]ONK21757.1 pyridine nucleotide-disulfide oxidoreductase [Bacillus sp. VT-16-64]
MTGNENLVICRCEEVTFGQIQTTVETYTCSARELKLRTRAGMGFCGGRTCRVTLDRLIEEVLPGISVSDIPLKYQPPVRPVTFGTAGDLDD